VEISAVVGAGFVIFMLFLLVIGVGSVALWVWGLVDAATRPEWVFQRAGSNKVMWIVLIAVLGVIAAIVYLLAVRPRLASVQQSSQFPAWGHGGVGSVGAHDWSRQATWDTAGGWPGAPPTATRVASAGTGAAAGWYGDPSGRHRMRYWDGAWTASVWDGGEVTSDPPTL
jgi:hypothetical protein